MKTITFIRHAKSDKSDPSMKDIDRWLDKKAEKQIKQMWKILKNLDFETELILCSKANRAKLTLYWLKSEYKKLDIETRFVDEIYNFNQWSYKEMINIIKETENKIDNITIIWHNPLISEAINYFINTSWFRSRTLWVTKIIFDIEKWKQLENNWKLIFYISPEI